MKEIEKLAKEYADPEFLGAYEGYGVDAPEAFMAGFRKAREMAAEIIKNWDTSWYDEDLKLEAQRHDREFKIRKLGESEIGDSA